MNTPQYLLNAIEAAQKQLLKSFEGLPESLANHRLTDEAMTPLETLEHICHVYAAFGTVVIGGTWDWSGGWSTDLKTVPELLSKVQEMHQKALVDLESNAGDHAYEMALDYIILHHGYHVGQICLLRLSCEPGWDPYSIYG